VTSDDPRQFLPDLGQFLRDSTKIGAEFNKALKKGSVEVAKNVVGRAKQNASTAAEREVAKGLVPKFDRVPSIQMNKTQFVSTSRRNAKRSPAAKARRIDVFFGTEFGGGKYGRGNRTRRNTSRGGVVRKGGGYTSQFRPHLGKQGYFFYPTVRREGPNTVREYARVIDEVRKDWERGRL
jgi:hypothetical protein